MNVKTLQPGAVLQEIPKPKTKGSIFADTAELMIREVCSDPLAVQQRLKQDTSLMVVITTPQSSETLQYIVCIKHDGVGYRMHTYA